MGKAALTVGRCALTRRIVERRIHQNARHLFRREPRRGEGTRRRRDVEHDGTDPPGKSVGSRILRRQRGEPGSISTSVTRAVLDALRERQPGRTHARPEIHDPFARARRARRRQQDGVMADTVAASGLLEQQPAAEHGIRCDSQRASGRSSWPRPASSSNLPRIVDPAHR